MADERKYYLTKERLIRLKAEYRHLNKIKASKTKGEFPRFLHSEDLNSEYLSFYEDLGFLETRLAELKTIIRDSELIKIPSKGERNIVNLGATVLVEVDGQTDEFTILGSLEANPTLGKISNESPVGKAILGHRVGEEIFISSPVEVVYKIKKIRYIS